MGLAEAITILLMTLKLLGLVSYGWFIVFLPMIIVYGLALIFFCIYMLIIMVIGR